MSTTTTTPWMTLEEFEALPDTAGEIELVRGELVRLPPPTREHMRLVKRLYKKLDAAVEACREANAGVPLGDVEIEMGYSLGSRPRSWLRPDVSITHSGQAGAKYYEGAPLLVFEIVSEHDRSRDLERKVVELLRGGALEIWLIYPEEKYAWVHRAGEAAAKREERAITSAVLPGVEIPFVEFL